jgi:hypothetical protein
LRYGFLHPRFGVIPLADEKGHLSPEVSHYYGSAEVDMDGMRVRTAGPERRGRNGGGVEGGRGSRGKSRGRGDSGRGSRGRRGR